MNLMGVPELVHSTRQNLSSAVRHPSSPRSGDIRHPCQASSLAACSSKKPRLPRLGMTGPRRFQFPLPLLYFLSRTPTTIPSLPFILFFIQDPGRKRNGHVQNRTWDGWLCLFLPEHKASASAEWVLTLHSQTTAKAGR